jgi:hypothetical protein
MLTREILTIIRFATEAPDRSCKYCPRARWQAPLRTVREIDHMESTAALRMPGHPVNSAPLQRTNPT